MNKVNVRSLMTVIRCCISKTIILSKTRATVGKEKKSFTGRKN